MDILSVIKRSPVVFPLACVAAVAIVLVSEASYFRSVSVIDNLDAIADARTNIQALQSSVLDAETAQSDYLLSGRKAYLQPYYRSLKKIDAAFKFLDIYYSAEPVSSDLLGQLHSLTSAELATFAHAIFLRERGTTEEAAKVALIDIRQDMNAIRAVSGKLTSALELSANSHRDDLTRTLLVARTGMAALSAIGLFALFLYLRQNDLHEHHQQERRLVVQVERNRLETEVARRTTQLRQLSHHLLTAREDERNRLARNLHDELGSLLTSAKLDAARIKSRLADSAPEAQVRLAHLVETLNSSIALGRRIIEDLRPSTLNNLGLIATLDILARDFAAQSGIAVHCTLAPVRLDPPAELIVFRVVQEAITNISKYAKATNVWLTLDASNGQAQIVVRDDGVGFDADNVRTSAYGLVGMRLRAEANGGALHVVSTPGEGTQILMTLPETATPATN